MTVPDWLNKAIVYQIYPQTFYDSNHDGIGDIPGIARKLDYIEHMGYNTIWINPCYESPFNDAGYDVTDYYKVAPRYGTNKDLENLFVECKKRNIKVLLDLVPGHTSIDNEWFKQSCKPEKNKYTNWFVWTDSTWGEYNGYNTVKGYCDRDGNYIANFFWSQPALNYGFANPQEPWQLPVDHPDVKQVRREIINIMKFWLSKGADGFRIDMAFSLVKNDPGWKATSQYWQDVREEIQKDFPQAALIAEWSYPSAAIEAGFHGDFMIHIPNEDVYNTLFRMEKQNDAFDRNGDGHSYFSSAGKGDISVFLKKFNCHRDNIGKSGFVFLPSGNHDIIRISSGRTAKELEIVFAFLLTMPVVPTVYYGDEIGMHNIHGLISKEGGYKRTGARTPMQWSKEPNAGFSKASQDKLYLPVDKNKDAPDVQSQIKKDDSLLNAVRKLILLRKNNPALNPNAEYAELYVEKDTYPCIYLRQKEDIKFVIILNPSNRKHSVEIKTELELIKFSKIIGNNIEISRHGDHYKIGVEPVSYSILRNDF